MEPPSRAPRRLRVTALLLVAIHLAAATAPCPPPRDAVAAAAHAASARSADTESGGMEGHPAWCSGRTAAVWKAVCPCGCGDRPEALGSATGVGLALVSPVTTRLPAPPRAHPPLPLHAERMPEAPSLAIDHVPLPA